MPEWVRDCALQHGGNRERTFGFVMVRLNRAVLGCSSGDGFLLNGNRIVDKELDPDRSASGIVWAPRAIPGRLGREEELCAIDLKSSDDMSVTKMPENRRPERFGVELDCRLSIANRQHRRNLSHGRVIHNSPDGTNVLNGMDRKPVSSSSIVSVGYDPDNEVLEVEFEGGIYQYFEVPTIVYESLMSSTSLGGYFNGSIRDQYDFRQV